MKFIIDTDQCKNLNIPIDTLLYTAALYFKNNITYSTFSDACSRGYIEYSELDSNRFPENPVITEQGVEIIENVFLNSEFRKKDEKEDKYDALAKKLQELFPTGRKPGTSYMWRDATPVIARRLKSLVKKYNCEITEEKAIKATENYIQSFNGDYRYMQVLKYFIIKRNNNTGDENSQLLSYIQNIDQKDINNDWATEMR